MIGRRLQQLRLASNLSLEALAVQMGGLVTKQAISKYEHDKANPAPTVLAKMADVLGVKASFFFTEPSIEVEFLAYRKSGQLLEREGERLKNRIEHELEGRVEILELSGQVCASRIPIRNFPIQEPDDVEGAAEKLRSAWQLGLEPITNVTEMLENNSICVLDVEANEDFDGISAKVYDKEGDFKTVALVTRNEIDGARQRLNLTHELGHLVLNISENLDEEKVAFRFGTALLAPKKRVIEDVGEKRSLIQLQELFLFKKRFGISIQALIYRLYDLGIITESYRGQLFSMIYKLGWRKHEPEDWPFEKSYWLKRHVLRLFAEGVIDKKTAERIIGKEFEPDFPETVVQRREFLKLPLEKRRQILAEQANKVANNYAQVVEELEGGNIFDY